jgi:hypothetical protein
MYKYLEENVFTFYKYYLLLYKTKKILFSRQEKLGQTTAAPQDVATNTSRNPEMRESFIVDSIKAYLSLN